MNEQIVLYDSLPFSQRWNCTRSGITLKRIFSNVLALMLLFFGLSTKATAQTATIQTDKADYPPGSLVIINGGGWSSGETVRLQIVHVDSADNFNPAHAPWNVSADINGAVSSSWYVPFNTSELNATFILTADGLASGFHAEQLFTDAVGPGIAPVLYPGGGFDIDGDLQANAPTTGKGDWLAGPAGGGGNVLSASGAPIVPAVTFHLTDLYSSGSDDNFKGGMKFDNDPNDWLWTSNPVNDKQDMNNGLVHIGTDANGHIWLTVAADRLSPNGDAYIDFEFLQNSLTTTGTTSGGFVSAGPDGGRTVNDFVLTLELTNGGSTANFFFSRWKATSGGKFDYVDETALVPLGSTFAATNTTSIPASYLPFGNSNYPANTFAEAAVDLTKLIGNLQSCLEIGVKSLLIKTKESQSPTATIVDFIKPISVGFTVGAANAGPDQTICAQGASTPFIVTGFATPNPGDAVISTVWSVVPGSGSATIVSPNSSATQVNVTTQSVTLRFTVTTQKGCVVSDEVVLTVAQTVSCSITGDETVCPSSTNTYSGPSGATSYKWTISGDGTISGADNEQTVNVVASSGCNGSYVLSLEVANGDCTNTCSKTVTVKDVTAPVIKCPDPVTVECNAPAPDVTTVQVSDNCTRVEDIKVEWVSDDVSGTCPKTITRTYKATDACGNSSTCTQIITVNDVTDPTVSKAPGADKDLGCNPKDIDGNFSAPDFTDNCDKEPELTYKDVDGGEGCIKTRTRTWTATDDCGNEITASQKLTWKEDLVAPVISNCPEDTKVQCYADVTAAANVTALDNCDGAITPVYSETQSNEGSSCNNVITRTWIFTDACGNASTCTQKITVNDDTKPTVSKAPGADNDLGCNPKDIDGNFSAPDFTDNCDKEAEVTYKDVGGGEGCYKTRTRTWTATDDCGNEITASQKLTWKEDLVAPVISNCPEDTKVQCYADVTAPADVTAVDNCDGAITPVYSQTESKEGSSCGNVITRTWIFTDACGNASTCTQKITVNDDTKPTVSKAQGEDKDLGCNPKDIDGNFSAPEFTDNCDNELETTHKDVDGGEGCIKTRTRTWTATDDCGNEITASQKLTWKEDLVAPVISDCPEDTKVQCYADAPAPANVTALDNCDGAINPVYSETQSNEGSSCNNVITRTWIFTDACGNASTCTQKITVNDDTKPTVSKAQGEDKDLGCNPKDIDGNFSAPEFTDNCDREPGITYKDVDGGEGCIKTRTRTWTATDDCGNEITASQKLTWKEDLVAPVISDCPEDTKVQCYADVPAPANVTALDNCDGAITPVYSQTESKEGSSCNNVITRTWIFTDACGNSSTCIQKITVNDDTKPTVSKAPEDKDLGCNPKYFPAPEFTDNCDKELTVTYKDVDGGEGCYKTRIRTWTATDDCGNYVTASQKLTWKEDLVPPVFNRCPTDKTIQCITNCPAPPTVTATDNCDGVITPVYTQTESNPGSTCYNVITRTWIATDACGNKATCTQKITINDNTPPKIFCPADITVPGCKNTVTFKVNAKDNCGGPVTVVSVPASGSVFPVGTTVVTSTATDACGNKSTSTFKVTVTPPPACLITKPAALPTCTSTGNKLCATSSGGTGAITYKWIVSDPSWVITGGQGTNCITYTAGASGSSVTFTLIVKDAAGCKCICTITLNCTNEGCTPGFWKNATTYWDQATDPVASCVAAAIAAKGGQYSGTGTTTSLFRTTFGLTTAQMQAVGLNPNLTLIQAINLGGGSYNKLARHSVAGLLSSCGLKVYTYSTSRVLKMTHDAVVNKAAEPAASDIASANENGNCPLSSDGNADQKLETSVVSKTITTEVTGSIKAYPNPYRSEVNFQFTAPISGTAVLEVYDLLGQRLAVVFKGDVKAQILNVAKFNPPAGNRVPLAYKLTIGTHTYHGMVFPEK